MRRTGRPALIAIGALLAVVPMASATYGGHVVGRSTAMSLAYYTVAENGLISECSGAMVARTKIVTESGVVFLMGISTREEADAATNVARQVGGVQRVVKVFEYID